MFAKKNRLAKTKDIKTVLAAGRNFFNPFFTLKATYNQRARSRFAVVVSTKVSKKAVVRNRLKRLVREVLKRHSDGLPSGDYVVIIKPSAARKPEAEVIQNFRDLISQRITHEKK